MDNSQHLMPSEWIPKPFLRQNSRWQGNIQVHELRNSAETTIALTSDGDGAHDQTQQRKKEQEERHRRGFAEV